MIPSTIRPDDTMRGPRAPWGVTEEDEAEMRSTDSLIPPPLSHNDGSSHTEEDASRPGTAMSDYPSGSSKHSSSSKHLTAEETIELARYAVESGIQETKRSLAGSEAVTDVVKPKLTIDLGHSHIVRIPEPVVDIIKDEVERSVGMSRSVSEHSGHRKQTDLIMFAYPLGFRCLIITSSIFLIASLSAPICDT